MGMLNNPWFRIKVHHQIRYIDTDTDGVMDYISDATFEHPTLAGAQSGGWMQTMKEHPSLTSPGVYTDATNVVSSNNVVAVADAVIASNTVIDSKTAASLSIDPSTPSFTAEEIEEHNSKESAWIVVKDRVYDCTPFLKAHPGGAESILIMAGQEASEDFEAVHSKKAWKMLEEYFIGVLRPSIASSSEHHQHEDSNKIEAISGDTSSIEEKASYRDGNDNDKLITLNPKLRIKLPLVTRVEVSHDSILLRFELPSPKHILGLPVGQHMLCYAKVEDKLVMR